MKHLKLFETETNYNSATSEFEYPTVSLVQDVDEVRYMTLRDKYTNEYLTFEALESGTFTLTIPTNVNTTYMTSVSYSIDNGETWTTVDNSSSTVTITTPTIPAGNKVLWKGNGKTLSIAATFNKYSTFSSTGSFNISGNIMSLFYDTNFADKVVFKTGSTYNFCFLFREAMNLVSAENLILPATTLTDSCYLKMFFKCKELINAPELPATILAQSCYESMFLGCGRLTIAPKLPALIMKNGCYASMFDGCSSLVTAPELPAETLESSCYNTMFQDCASLVNAPELPATTLKSYCYRYMFNGCIFLTLAPVLPATTLASYCYESMFNGCRRLNYIKAMFTTTPSNTYTNNWVKNVAASGTFVKNSSAKWDVTGTNGVPSGWTVQTASA